MVTTIPSPSPDQLLHTQQGPTEPPERRRLPFQTVDFGVHHRPSRSGDPRIHHGGDNP